MPALDSPTSQPRPGDPAGAPDAEPADTAAPRIEATSVTIAAPDPRSLAAFYARLLSGEVVASEPARPGQPARDGWAQVRPPAGRLGLTLNFEFEPDYAPPVWPSAPGEQQLMEHLDLLVDDLDAAVAFAVHAGARMAGFQPQNGVRVLLDPAGHPFCLFT